MTTSSVLVTGGAGYIGSHAVKALHDQGPVVVYRQHVCRPSRGHPSCHRRRVGDIHDTSQLRATIREHRLTPSCTSPPGCRSAIRSRIPPVTTATMSSGALGSRRDDRREGALPRVFIDCRCIRQPGRNADHQSHPNQPINAYGRRSSPSSTPFPHYETAYGSFDRAAVFNAAGADPDGELGEDHHPEYHLIPRAIDAGASPTSLLPLFHLQPFYFAAAVLLFMLLLFLCVAPCVQRLAQPVNHRLHQASPAIPQIVGRGASTRAERVEREQMGGRAVTSHGRHRKDSAIRPLS